MKEGFLLVVAVSIIGAGAWYFTTVPTHVNAVVRSTNLASSVPNHGVATGASQLKRFSPKNASAIDPPSTVFVVDVPTEGAPVDERRLPPLTELQGVLDRDGLRERLGDPVLRATTLDRGALFETYVYQYSAHGAFITAYLRNGKVEALKSAN
jgi:hypothetical protein